MNETNYHQDKLDALQGEIRALYDILAETVIKLNSIQLQIEALNNKK